MDGIEIKLSDAAKALLEQGLGPMAIPALLAALDEQNELTAGEAVEKRMSFPRSDPPTLEGTRVITGRLRQSIRTSPARLSGDDTIVSAIGSNVRYFGPLEFGFDGDVQVPAHARRRPLRFLVAGNKTTISARAANRLGHLTKAGKARKGHAFVRAEGSVNVRAHTAHVRIAPRQMVAKTVADRADAYSEALTAALRTALEK